MKEQTAWGNLQPLSSDSQFLSSWRKLCLPAWGPFHEWAGRGRASLHHGQVFESVTPLLLGLVVGPEELDLPLLGLDLVPVLFQLLLGGHVRVGHRLEERDGAVKPLRGARKPRLRSPAWSGRTCMARWRLRAARLCENSLWTAENASENFSSPTCFFSSSISSCARFFRVGSGQLAPKMWLAPPWTNCFHVKPTKFI